MISKKKIDIQKYNVAFSDFKLHTDHLMFKTGFWEQNHLLYLCSSALNSQSLLCSQKAGVKCSY